jgi:hypothetical protein
MEIDRPGGLGDIASLGLTCLRRNGCWRRFSGKSSRPRSGSTPPTARSARAVAERATLKDYREHVVATLFGQVTVRLPRFRCATCGGIEAGVDWPSYCRATPELLQLQAHLSATMTYRTAADLLEQKSRSKPRSIPRPRLSGLKPLGDLQCSFAKEGVERDVGSQPCQSGECRSAGANPVGAE